MSSPLAALPQYDQYTSYNYERGLDRMKAVQNKKFKVEELALNFQQILSNPFNEELRIAFQKGYVHMPVLPLKVSYFNGSTWKTDEGNALSKEKTVEFTAKAIEKWAEQAEKVLSATESGSLYWNIIHHFGSFTNLLDVLKNDGEKE